MRSLTMRLSRDKSQTTLEYHGFTQQTTCLKQTVASRTATSRFDPYMRAALVRQLTKAGKDLVDCRTKYKTYLEAMRKDILAKQAPSCSVIIMDRPIDRKVMPKTFQHIICTVYKEHAAFDYYTPPRDRWQLANPHNVPPNGGRLPRQTLLHTQL